MHKRDEGSALGKFDRWLLPLLWYLAWAVSLVNRVRIKALRPFTQPLTCYGMHEMVGNPGGSLPGDITTNELGYARRASAWGSALVEGLSQLAALVFRDHEYGSMPSQGPPGFYKVSVPPVANLSSASSPPSTDSEALQEDQQPAAKRKCKSHYSMSEVPASKILQFDPENIVHPRSTEWVPYMEVKLYVRDRLR